jgi:hypothetical protein
MKPMASLPPLDPEVPTTSAEPILEKNPRKYGWIWAFLAAVVLLAIGGYISFTKGFMPSFLLLSEKSDSSKALSSPSSVTYEVQIKEIEEKILSRFLPMVTELEKKVAVLEQKLLAYSVSQESPIHDSFAVSLQELENKVHKMSKEKSQEALALPLIILEYLRKMVDKGQVYGKPLSLLRQFTQPQDSKIHDFLNRLEHYSSLGVPSYEHLKRHYENFRRPRLKTEDQSDAQEGFWSFMKNMIKIEKKDHQSFEEEGFLKEIDAKIQMGAWQDVLSLCRENKGLSMKRVEVQAFLQHLEARLEVDGILAALRHAWIDRLSVHE